MPLTIEKDDYVVVRDTNSKEHKPKGKLVRVTRNKSGDCKGVFIQKYMDDNDKIKYVEFTASDVLTVLGPRPSFGTAYGCKIELYYGYSTTKLGPLYYWRSIDQLEKLRLEKVVASCYAQLKKDRLLPGKDIELTVRHPQGSMVGHYKACKKKERADELCLQPLDFSKRSYPLSELTYVFYHEYAHCLWFTRMSPEQQGEWVKAYSRNVTLAKIKTENLEKYRQELVENGRVSDYSKGLDDEGKEEFRECLKWIKRIHNIMPRHINALLVDNSDLMEYWPKSGMALQRKQVIISDYALKAVEEFFAEAFGFHYSETKAIPKSIIKLLERTKKELRAGSGDVRTMDDDDEIKEAA